MENIYTTSQIQKNNCFHLIRLICCLVVIYEHSIILNGCSAFNFNLRGFAVNIFFVLSGFWVTMSYLKSNSIIEYAYKRFSKILPMYWLVVLGFALILVLASSLNPLEYYTHKDFWKYLLANLSTLNFLQPSLPCVFDVSILNGAVNGSLWTIKVELGFYICLPIVFWFITRCSKIKRVQTSIIILIILYSLSVLYKIACIYLINKYGKYYSLEHQLPEVFVYFISGMIFSLYREKLFPKLNLFALISVSLFLLSILLKNFYFNTILKPLLIGTLVVWAGFKLTFLNKIVKIDYSYPMYLIHFPIIQLFIKYGLFQRSFAISFIGVLGTTFLLSYLLQNMCKKI